MLAPHPTVQILPKPSGKPSDQRTRSYIFLMYVQLTLECSTGLSLACPIGLTLACTNALSLSDTVALGAAAA